MSNIDNIWSELKRKAEEATSIDILNPSKSVKQRGDVIRAQCCTESKKYKKSKLDISQSQLNKMAPYTDYLPLQLYEGCLELVPNIVNVVTLVEALPRECSKGGAKLPLDLHYIAARCTNSYYAPKRFAAVQLAFSNPRSRILVFRKFCVVKHIPHCTFTLIQR